MAGLLILDRTDQLEATDPLYAFALDELLCRAAGAGGPAVCHLWRHPRAFVMGLRDSRLPRAREAADRLADQGYGVAVRNSGGAAVPLDPGVVNLSLILPKDRAEDMAFHGDFERMYDLIRLAVRQLGGEAAKGEVVGSYCPGDFDLSIAGRKFCGIAQRRQVKSYSVQAFVIAEGEGDERARVVREFYGLAADGADPSAYPDVGTDRMASLAELTGAGAAGLARIRGGADGENGARGGDDAGGVADGGMGGGISLRFAAAVKDVIRAYQTPSGLAGAEAALRLPTPEEVEAMAASLRTRYGI
ncbi:lipoate--protein ligase family protein [Cohnella hashimotonis]|uniref:Lipoate--protein ligase family protein n=1 Tax=Cohnella hashimotonis TaxID=2826895 RepID=A0ABT6TV05_9BACL|nr:lipoate--protein ligase family protein [Cohnella hashimotonis]MDI4650033.1 lipoate--protein ligase family protein [Cohnella hashimotonis]